MAWMQRAHAQQGNPRQQHQMNSQQMRGLQQAQMAAAQQAQQQAQILLEQQQQMSIPQRGGQRMQYISEQQSEVVPQENIQGYPLQGRPFATNSLMPLQRQHSPATATLNAPLRTLVSSPGSRPMRSGQQLPQFAQNGASPLAIGHSPSTCLVASPRDNLLGNVFLVQNGRAFYKSLTTRLMIPLEKKHRPHQE